MLGNWLRGIWFVSIICFMEDGEERNGDWDNSTKIRCTIMNDKDLWRIGFVSRKGVGNLDLREGRWSIFRCISLLGIILQGNGFVSRNKIIGILFWDGYGIREVVVLVLGIGFGVGIFGFSKGYAGIFCLCII